MSYSYPIWNNVEACIYGSSKSWGARNTCNVNVNVGSSAKYSNHFVNHTTTKSRRRKRRREERQEKKRKESKKKERKKRKERTENKWKKE